MICRPEDRGSRLFPESVPPPNPLSGTKVLDHQTQVVPSMRRQKPVFHTGSKLCLDPNRFKALPLANRMQALLNEGARRTKRRRERVPLPLKKEKNKENKINLSQCLNYPPPREVRKTVLRNFKRRLKKKSDETYAMMCRLSTLIKGVIFKTHYVHHGSEEFVSCAPGYVRIEGKPSFQATRLLIENILHCRSNAPIGRIVEVINK